MPSPTYHPLPRARSTTTARSLPMAEIAMHARTHARTQLQYSTAQYSEVQYCNPLPSPVNPPSRPTQRARDTADLTDSHSHSVVAYRVAHPRI